MFPIIRVFRPHRNLRALASSSTVRRMPLEVSELVAYRGTLESFMNISAGSMSPSFSSPTLLVRSSSVGSFAQSSSSFATDWDWLSAFVAR